MKLKRILSLLLGFAIVIGMCTFSYALDTASAVDINKLCAFGVLDKRSDDLSRPVSRIEMVRYVTALYGKEAAYMKGETNYVDVLSEHEYSGAVNFAYSKGIISPSDYFFPERTVKYEEAVKMIVTALGYNEIAVSYGGYPNGYINVAFDIGLLKGVQSGEGHGVTLITCATLLDNALSCKVCSASMIVTKDGKTEYIYENAKDSDTVLEKRFSITKYGAYVKEINNSKKTIKAEILSKEKNSSSQYNAGEEVLFTFADSSFIDDCKYAIADIYTDSEGVICYLKNHKGIEVFSDNILEINKSKNMAPNNPKMMENIAFENSEDYIDIAENCNMFYNGTAVDKSKSYNFIGSFARAVIYNDEVISLEAWDLTEGGLVSSVGIGDITYQKGDIKGLEIRNITSFEEVNIILNGVKSEIYSLNEGCVFDFYEDEDKKLLLIVASSIAITDTLETVGTEGLRIGGDIYPLSSKYNCYVSDDGENFSRALSVTELLSRTVMAYLDSAGYVRYVKPVLDDELSKEYFGIITGYNKEGLSEPEFSVCLLKDDTVEKGVYTLSESLIKNNSLLIDKIIAETEELREADSALKNDAIKKADLFYKIKVNDKGKITKISVPSRFSEPVLNENYAAGTDGLLFNSSFTTLAVPQIANPRIYFPDAKICLFYYSAEGEMQVDLVTWNDITGRACSSMLLTPFAEPRSSKIDVMLMRGDAESLKVTRGDYVKKGLLTDITLGYDKESDSEVLNVKVDGKDYIVSKYKNMFEGVTDAAYILYSEGNSLIKSNEIMPVTIFNLSGSPDSWKLSAARQEGLHRDEIDFIDSERVYFKSGDVWYFNENEPVYELVEANGKVKFVKSSRGAVPEGAECFYIYQYYEARALFFER